MLVEMIIALALTSGVLVLATTLFITGLRGNTQVVTTTQATMQAQGVAQGVERAVRNARRIALTDCASTNTNCSTITVWTTLAGDQSCQVWTVDDGTIHSARGATAAGTPAPYGTGIDGASIAFGTAVLDTGGRVVGVTYEVTFPSDTRPVTVSGTVRSRTPRDITAPTTCGIAA